LAQISFPFPEDNISGVTHNDMLEKSVFPNVDKDEAAVFQDEDVLYTSNNSVHAVPHKKESYQLF
jgi:hypothetical protein